ncbi:hypothetical protein HPB51_004610 [Rhipicephalus microplus]|uniref:Uncharacterized protein n=1 Tax=Rhipicephalus microplus TaxID=6941 RepID=A0A9J6ELN2_RHIMP|nr:hypothetical protein HPB51_004610 [Rhipicephalus microplus]
MSRLDKGTYLELTRREKPAAPQPASRGGGDALGARPSRPDGILPYQRTSLFFAIAVLLHAVLPPSASRKEAFLHPSLRAVPDRVRSFEWRIGVLQSVPLRSWSGGKTSFVTSSIGVLSPAPRHPRCRQSQERKAKGRGCFTRTRHCSALDECVRHRPSQRASAERGHLLLAAVQETDTTPRRPLAVIQWHISAKNLVQPGLKHALRWTPDLKERAPDLIPIQRPYT